MSEEYIISLNRNDADLLYDIGSGIGGLPDPGHPRHTIDIIMKQLYNQGIRHDVNETIFSIDIDGLKPISGIYLNKKIRKNDNMDRLK